MRVDQLRYRSRKHLLRGKKPQTYTPNAHRSDAPISTKTAEQTRKTCSRCGRGSHPRDKCPAKDAACHKCGKKGHYNSQCFSQKISEVTIYHWRYRGIGRTKVLEDFLSFCYNRVPVFILSATTTKIHKGQCNVGKP